MSEVNDTARVAAPPSFADQVAALDAGHVTDLAARIADHGARAAMSASTVEIVAMACRFNALNTIANLTFDLLATADLVPLQKDPAVRQALKVEVSQKIYVVGASLEALGYGQPMSTQEEKNDGASQD